MFWTSPAIVYRHQNDGDRGADVFFTPTRRPALGFDLGRVFHVVAYLNVRSQLVTLFLNYLLWVSLSPLMASLKVYSSSIHLSTLESVRRYSKSLLYYRISVSSRSSVIIISIHTINLSCLFFNCSGDVLLRSISPWNSLAVLFLLVSHDIPPI